jgi:hypothetical protein
MTREEALEKLKEPALNADTVRQEFEYVATKLGITTTELQTYLEMPKKSFRDYKSQESIYAIGARAMRLFGLELGGKR